ncbi:MAG: peptidylprolyl isomerase [Anaerolineales bacterium]|nr:peptidylprolyl isomerase [Anaerolineales bacterium]
MQKTFLPFLIGIALLTACDLQSVFHPVPTGTPTATAMATPTPVPLAARVNGEGIPLEEFEDEVARFEAAQERLGNDPGALGDYRRIVLQAMIEERVAAQAAAALGRTILDDQVDAVVESVRQARSGDEGLQAWLTENFYTLEEFRAAVRRQLLVRAATDSIADQVPPAAEQVHARHILVGNLGLANTLRDMLLTGSDFAELARTYSQDFSTSASGGDLGWFPRGILNISEVEEAAFSLQPLEISPVVQSRLGYHVIQTLEHESSRPLTPAALETLRRQAVQQWLAQQMQNASIEIYI